MSHENHSFDYSSLSTIFNSAIPYNVQLYKNFMEQHVPQSAKEFTGHHTACKAALAHIGTLLKLHALYTPNAPSGSGDPSSELEVLLRQARTILANNDR